ncbi:MAG: TerB N-terminal domain-containing protein, partial [Candidatus Tectomicrobia bacterium]|nr:TerB N-terminal domain-containing protein [Candidatus Tectomicrobia bacterium]
HPDREGRNMSYWPSYSQIHPASRAAFLEWLSSGRKDPRAYIGYVFIYFYGLERRALADAKDSASARNDLPAIITEVKRLLSIYGENNSFRGYASKFLDALKVSQTTVPLYHSPPQFEYSSYEVPLALKLALGQMATDSVPLSAEWALAWAENDPSMPRRMPAQRCPEEFRELFRIRYNDKFGEGLKLKPNKTRIRATYYPASSSFGGQIEIPMPDLPDLTEITGPSSKINDLVATCTDELEGYSRYLGRNPDGRNSIEAASYLPQSLLKKHAGKEFQNLSTWLNATISSEDPVSVPFSLLLQHVPSINRDGFGKKEATAIAGLLGKINVGIEPDPRFGNFIPKLDQDMVLFRVSDNAPNSPSAEYSAAAVVLHLASAVAGADGTVDPDEERHLEEHIETWLHLAADEKTRLRAHTQWLLSSFAGMNGVKKRIEVLKQGQRESLGRFLVGVAQADGYIDPMEMKILKKIYDMLGLDSQSLYSHAHAAAIEPVTVQTADFVKQQGYAIPSPSPKPSEGISLDPRTIEAKFAETVAVSDILNNIFIEEEPAPPAPSVESSSPLESIAGLDVETSAFMRTLATKLEWKREELESLAAEKNLMLDGMLDSINDASFDYFGGPFFEGDNPIEINAEFAKEMSA